MSLASAKAAPSEPSSSHRYARDAAPVGLKILHVLDHSLPIHSGYSFRTFSLLKEQRQLGWATAHLTTPKHTDPRLVVRGDVEEFEGFRFYRTPFRDSPALRIPVISEARLIAAVARRIIEVAELEKPHVLHAHSPVLNALACFLANRKLRLPVVYEVRAFWEDAAVGNGTTREKSLRYHAVHALESFALRNCDGIVTICVGLKLDMVRRGVPENKIAVVPNGVDLAQFPFLSHELESGSAGRLKRSLGLEGHVVAAFFGSFYPYEGLDILLRALPLVLRRAPHLRVLLAGGGPQETDLRRLADELKLGDAVRFLGRVPHDTIERYYKIADLLIFPRRKMRLTETVTPLKPLEAMAVGAIVCASDVGGHRELVRPGTGYLFPSDSVHGLAEALIGILNGKAGWPAMRAAARRYVETERTWRVCASGYQELYARLFLRSTS